MNTDEAWEKFKLNDSDRIGKSSTAAMLETILAQQNAINAKVDQILDENKGVPAEDAEEESADIPPAPPMDMGGPDMVGAPDMGGIPGMGDEPALEGEAPPDAGANPADSMPPVDESALLGGAPQDLNGGVPEPAPDMGVAPDMDGMPDLGDTSGDEGGGEDEGIDDSTPFSFLSDDYGGDEEEDENITAITDAITSAEDVDVQLGMTQILQEYLSKKKAPGADALMADEGPLDAIADAIAPEALEGDLPPMDGDVPPEDDGAGIADILGEESVPPIDEGTPEGAEGMADMLGAIVGDEAGALPDAEPASDVLPEEGESEDEDEPIIKSESKDKKSEEKDEEDSEDEKSDKDKKSKNKDKKKYPWDDYLDDEDDEDDEDDDDDKEEDSDNDSGDETDSEDDNDVEFDGEEFTDADIAAIEEIVGKKMSELIDMLRGMLGDEASDEDPNPLISKGTDMLGPNTDPFMACGDSPEAMDTLTRSIDSLIEDRMRGLRGNDGKMYKVVKSEAQLRDEKTDKLKRSLSSNAVYHMTGRQVLDAIKGLEDNGVESVKKSFVNPYDVIVRSLDCAVGQEKTDRFLKASSMFDYVDVAPIKDYDGSNLSGDDLVKYRQAQTIFRNIIKSIDDYHKNNANVSLASVDKGDLKKMFNEVPYFKEKRITKEGKPIMEGTMNPNVLNRLLEIHNKNHNELMGNRINDIIDDEYAKLLWDPVRQKYKDLYTVAKVLESYGAHMSNPNLYGKLIGKVGRPLTRMTSTDFNNSMLNTPDGLGLIDSVAYINGIKEPTTADRKRIAAQLKKNFYRDTDGDFKEGDDSLKDDSTPLAQLLIPRDSARVLGSLSPGERFQAISKLNKDSDAYPGGYVNLLSMLFDTNMFNSLAYFGFDDGLAKDDEARKARMDELQKTYPNPEGLEDVKAFPDVVKPFYRDDVYYNSRIGKLPEATDDAGGGSTGSHVWDFLRESEPSINVSDEQPVNKKETDDKSNEQPVNKKETDDKSNEQPVNKKETDDKSNEQPVNKKETDDKSNEQPVNKKETDDKSNEQPVNKEEANNGRPTRKTLGGYNAVETGDQKRRRTAFLNKFGNAGDGQ